MFCKNNEQQLSACHHDANMKYQTYSSSFQVFHFFFFLRKHGFIWLLCSRLLKEVQPPIFLQFSHSTACVASLSTPKHIVWMAPSVIFYLWSFTERVTWAVNHVHQHAVGSFFPIFTVIIGILSTCLILTFGNISIQNCDSSIYKK